jgi:hypothetical protein
MKINSLTPKKCVKVEKVFELRGITYGFSYAKNLLLNIGKFFDADPAPILEIGQVNFLLYPIGLQQDF